MSSNATRRPRADREQGSLVPASSPLGPRTGRGLSRAGIGWPIRLALIALTLGVWSGPGRAEVPAAEPATLAEPRTCLSLSILARESLRDPLPREVETLAGISWIEGFLVDADGRDVILVGRAMPDRPTLHLDDLVVVLRNIWNREPPP